MIDDNKEKQAKGENKVFSSNIMGDIVMLYVYNYIEAETERMLLNQNPNERQKVLNLSQCFMSTKLLK